MHVYISVRVERLINQHLDGIEQAYAVFSSGVRLGTDHSTVVHLFFYPLTYDTYLSVGQYNFFLSHSPFLSLIFLVSHLLSMSSIRRPRRHCPVQLASHCLTRLMEAARRGGKRVRRCGSPGRPGVGAQLGLGAAVTRHFCPGTVAWVRFSEKLRGNFS
jgi:hypothetical protein